MKDSIIVIGSGGFAKEVIFLIHQNFQYEIQGFSIDKEYVPKGGKLLGYPFLGDIDELVRKTKEPINLVIAIGNPEVKKKIQEKLSNNSYFQFPNLIHATSLIGINIELGIGNILMPYTTLTADISMGNFNMVNIGCTIGHDVQIGSFNSFYPSNNISGNVMIKNGCELGVGTKIIPNCVLEEGVISGAGTVIINDVPKNTTVVGNPSRIIRTREK